MDALDSLSVHGYRWSLVSFGFVEPLRTEQQHPERVNGLELREHGLAGGELQMFLDPSNRGSNDAGVYYAALCTVDVVRQQQPEAETIGTIVVRRLADDGSLLGEVTLDLEPLDESHLLDRLRGETLTWHARDFGPGPWAPKTAKAALKAG